MAVKMPCTTSKFVLTGLEADRYITLKILVLAAKYKYPNTSILHVCLWLPISSLNSHGND